MSSGPRPFSGRGAQNIRGDARRLPRSSDAVGGLGGDAGDLLGGLVDRSLVQRDPRPSGDMRYLMLETIRDYGLEQLELLGETDDARLAHAICMMEISEEAEPHLTASDQEAWIDRLAVPGATFSYTEDGPEGLAGGKKIIIASSRGGFPTEALDHQETYLRTIFGFFGIADIIVVRAEGVALGEEAKVSAINVARGEIASLAA